MNWLRIVLIASVVAIVGAGAAAYLLLQDDGHSELTGARPAAPRPVETRESVLTDVQGTVIEEFSGDCAGSRYPYVCRYVRDQLLAYDKGLLGRGGLTIRTTIDQRAQRAAERAIDSWIGPDDPQVASQVLIVPGEGAIRAMATSADSGEAPALQQGTTAMPYTLAAALAKGMHYDDGFLNPDTYQAAGYTAFKNCKGENVGDPMHIVHNRKPGGGRFTTLRSGAEAAANTFFIRLQENVGLCETVETAERLGLRRADARPLQEVETFTLGVNEADPVSVAVTYATFAARGLHCEPTAIAEIKEPSGAVRAFPPRCAQALDPGVADAVTGLLKADHGTLDGVGRDAAGMPGTADGYMTAWYAGYTPGLASAVSLGVPPQPFLHPLRDVTIKGRHYEQVDGSTIAAPIWKATMTAALSGTAGTAFTAPDAGRFGGCRDFCER
ncbi:hypothetical protein [Sphaerisporangium dianthi]|uniref:Penicillin-binding protein n=1 Tax=Sphaerisporangium dianthi TaxID=1436120 RepID=A0ABV9C8L4_9ACTN